MPFTGLVGVTMSNTLRQYADLMEKVESLNRKAERAQGACEQLIKQLKEEFGVGSVEKGDKLLRDMEAEIERLKNEIEDDMNKIQSKWGDRLL